MAALGATKFSRKFIIVGALTIFAARARADGRNMRSYGAADVEMIQPK